MSDDEDYWKRRAKKLPERAWGELQEAWRPYAATLDVVGNPPQESIETFLETAFDKSVLPTAQDGAPTIVVSSAGVRAAVLAHSRLALLRAAHLLAAAEAHLRVGAFEWSFTTAYHSACFGMRSVLFLFGIVPSQLHGRHVVLDIWYPGARPKVQLHDFAILGVKRFEHRHQWRLFQRMMRVVDRPPWASSLTAPLLDLDPKDFARQRNSQIYELTGSWVPELTATLLDDPLVLPDRLALEDLGDPDSRRFSLTLALVMVHAAAKCFSDLPATITADAELTNMWSHAGELRWFEGLFEHGAG